MISNIYELTLYPPITITDNSYNNLPEKEWKQIVKDIYSYFGRHREVSIHDIIKCTQDATPIFFK